MRHTSFVRLASTRTKAKSASLSTPKHLDFTIRKMRRSRSIADSVRPVMRSAVAGAGVTVSDL